MGSNSEKKIVENTASMFSGILLRANYFESAAGSLSILLLKYTQGHSDRGYVIDPATYVFALSPDIANDKWSIRSWKRSVRRSNAEVLLRRDLRMDNAEAIPESWIRPFSKDGRDLSPMVQYWGITTAYRKLADHYFDKVVAHWAGKKAISPSDLGWKQKPSVEGDGCPSMSLTSFVERTTQYQLDAVKKALEGSGLPGFKVDIAPKFVLSPYFRISRADDLEFMKDIWNVFRQVYPCENGAAVLLVDKEFLSRSLNDVVSALLKSQLKHVFLWIPALREEQAEASTLHDMAELVMCLSRDGVGAINLYAGGFSTALLRFGLEGIVNGPGYGMDRDVQPVKGGMPQAKYYLPQSHSRKDINDTLDIVSRWSEARTREGFLKTVCSCPVCRDGIQRGLADIIMYYGEAVRARNGNSERYVPSKRALDRCSYHFVFARLVEYMRVCESERASLIEGLHQDARKCEGKADYVETWARLLEELSVPE
jgi:hypothetical protein